MVTIFMMHTMIVGMLAGMTASNPEKYILASCSAFFVWLILLAADEYYLRIHNKIRFEKGLNEHTKI